MSPLTEQLVAHDLDDTRMLLDLAKQLPDDDYRRAQLPGNTTLSWDGPEESLADVLDQDRVHQGGLAGRDRGHGLPARAGRRPGDAGRAARRRRAALARHGPRHRPARRLGRPADRRAVRPARELRDQQRRRARPHLLHAPAPAGPPADPRLRAQGRQRRPDQLAPRPARRGPGQDEEDVHDPDHLLHRHHARRLHRRRAGLAGLAVRPGPGRAGAAQLRGVPRRARRRLHGLDDVRVDPRAREAARLALHDADVGVHPPRAPAATRASPSCATTCARSTSRWSRRPAARTSGSSAAATSPASSPTPGCSTRSSPTSRR